MGLQGGGRRAPPTPCIPPEPTAAAIWDRIFRPSCALSSCHGTATHANLDLSSLEASCAALIEQPSCELPTRTRVIPGDPDDSLLLQKLVCVQLPQVDCTPALGEIDPACPGTGANHSNLRMPFNNPPLPACLVESIRTWILLGAPGCPQTATDAGP